MPCSSSPSCPHIARAQSPPRLSQCLCTPASTYERAQSTMILCKPTRAHLHDQRVCLLFPSLSHTCIQVAFASCTVVEASPDLLNYRQGFVGPHSTSTAGVPSNYNYKKTVEVWILVRSILRFTNPNLIQIQTRFVISSAVKFKSSDPVSTVFNPHQNRSRSTSENKPIKHTIWFSIHIAPVGVRFVWFSKYCNRYNCFLLMLNVGKLHKIWEKLQAIKNYKYFSSWDFRQVAGGSLIGMWPLCPMDDTSDRIFESYALGVSYSTSSENPSWEKDL